MTYERIIFTEISDEPRKVYKGVPQGGVLSSLLYILYVAYIEKNIPKEIKVSQFADNIAIYIKTKNPGEDKKILENAISIVKENLLQLGLEQQSWYILTKIIYYQVKLILK